MTKLMIDNLDTNNLDINNIGNTDDPCHDNNNDFGNHDDTNIPDDTDNIQ